MKLGSNIKKLCRDRGWSYARLAREAGVPPQTVHNWIAGRQGVNATQLKKVATALKVPIHQLMFGEPDPFESPSEEFLKEIFSGDVRITLHRIEKKRF